MKLIVNIFTGTMYAALIFSWLIFFPPTHVVASSDRAYQDYIYQYDVYRQTEARFLVAKNEYDKFSTLNAEQQALDAAKKMYAQRDLTLRTYLFLLNEKTLETTSLSLAEREQYQALIANEVTFLNNHATLIDSVASIKDAINVADELAEHYTVLHTSIRQIILGISLAELKILQNAYKTTQLQLQSFIQEQSSVIPPRTKATIDRWLLQITNKHSLSVQKHDQAFSDTNNMNIARISKLDQQFFEIQNSIVQSKQYLYEGAKFMNEVTNALRYKY